MPRKPRAPLSRPLFSEPVFQEEVPTPDPSQFKVTPDDQQFYTKEVNALLKTEAVGFNQASGKPTDLFALADAWGPHGSDVINSINTANAITFHVIGDSGATKQSAYASEIKVADAVTNDFHSSSAADRPSFLYHLGDVVYNFGESNYYYDQFYEPFRNYAAPIFAIPGNHDSFILPGTAKGEEPLTTFTRNFCGTSLVVTKEAGSLHRTCMLQPGVYFALDAPFVRILGLFSNALEDPGVISSESGSAAAANRKTAKSAGTAKWPAVPDYQLAFLSAQLEQIKSSNYPGAVIIAVHHPPFTYSPQGAPSGGGTHYGSPIMLSEIDAICQQIGVYPHAVLSGHAHNYQRYTRNLTFNGKKYSVPFIICGDSGHDVTALARASFGKKNPEPGDNLDVSYMDTSATVHATGLTLNRHDQQNSGYLRVTVSAQKLTFTFNPVTKTGGAAKTDTVSVDLATHLAA
jgi:hypothetical protein